MVYIIFFFSLKCSTTACFNEIINFSSYFFPPTRFSFPFKRYEGGQLGNATLVLNDLGSRSSRTSPRHVTLGNWTFIRRRNTQQYQCCLNPNTLAVLGGREDADRMVDPPAKENGGRTLCRALTVATMTCRRRPRAASQLPVKSLRSSALAPEPDAWTRGRASSGWVPVCRYTTRRGTHVSALSVIDRKCDDICGSWLMTPSSTNRLRRHVRWLTRRLSNPLVVFWSSPLSLRLSWL